jgi:hypothetical protein
MAKVSELVTKASEPEKVDAYVAGLKHPLTQVVKNLRQIILSIDGDIGEEIKWNAPTFFYAGPMKPANPKEYSRYIVVFNLFRKDCIRLVFPRRQSQRFVRIAGRRLCGRKATRHVLQH